MKLEDFKTTNVIKTEGFEVGENVFKYDHAVIQLSNISYFDVSPMPKVAFPLWALVGAVIGFLLLFIGETVPIMIGLVTMALCIFAIYNIYTNNTNLGDYLILAMNSGKTFYFPCYSKQFLYEVENVILQCFKDESLKYSVDLKDCIIVHKEDNMNINDNTGSIVIGDHSIANAEHTGSIDKDEEITNEEWEKLEDAFREVASKTVINSYEHMLAVSAQYQISKKDKMGLRKVIKENLNDFRNNIFSKIAMEGIIEIVKRIMK